MSNHTCHNPNCGKPLSALMVSHRSSWYALPKTFRDAIWLHYRPGQERDKKPTKEYLDALDSCIAYWRTHKTQCREAK